MPLIQDLPRIDSPSAAVRWLRLLGRALACLIGWAVWPVPRPDPPLPATPADTVVLVTLDGVRVKELLTGRDPCLDATTPGAPVMPYLVSTLAQAGVFIGSDRDPPDMRIGSPIGISMSGYHSIFSGRMVRCIDNEDPMPPGSTLLTDLERQFAGQISAIATWPLLLDRIRHDATRTLAVKGADEARQFLHAQGCPLAEDVPADEPIMQAALTQLRTAPPKFLYVGLDASDNAAHSGSYERYLGVLDSYDAFLKDLYGVCQDLTEAGRCVTLLITTDHGRGEGEEWVEHRWNILGTARVWLCAVGHGIPSNGHIRPAHRVTHYDLRPTILWLLGIRPERKAWRGNVICDLSK